MSDVARILGVEPKPPPAAPETHQQPSRAMKMLGIPKQVMDLVGGNSGGDLPPMVPKTVKIGNKFIQKDKPARKWAWAPFSSSARTDGLLLHHWVRANVEYPDYPFARFDIHLDPVTYSEEEYAELLKDDRWTKSETDRLMEFARRFELRWPVIHDRWTEEFAGDTDGMPKDVVDLQHRYYHVAALLNRSRLSHEAAEEAKRLGSALADNPSDDNLLVESAAAQDLASSDPAQQPMIHIVGTGTSNKAFDYKYEKERRDYMEALWKRTKAEEEEEAALRKELKEVEAQLRKFKKSGGHVLAGGASNSSSRNPPRSTSPIPTESAIENAFASTTPTPVPHVPYLQSSRFVPPAAGGVGGINKSLLSRLQQLLTELNIPEDVIPTKRTCDLYDSVRRDALTLLILQKNIAQKEGQLQTKRLKMSKIPGSDVQISEEETLLGIAPTPARPAATSKKAAVPKAKTTSNESAVAVPAVTEEAKKAAIKRKRKEGKTPPPPSSEKKAKKA